MLVLRMSGVKGHFPPMWALQKGRVAFRGRFSLPAKLATPVGSLTWHLGPRAMAGGYCCIDFDGLQQKVWLRHGPMCRQEKEKGIRYKSGLA